MPSSVPGADGEVVPFRAKHYFSPRLVMVMTLATPASGESTDTCAVETDAIRRVRVAIGRCAVAVRRGVVVSAARYTTPASAVVTLAAVMLIPTVMATAIATVAPVGVTAVMVLS